MPAKRVLWSGSMQSLDFDPDQLSPLDCARHSQQRPEGADTDRSDGPLAAVSAANRVSP